MSIHVMLAFTLVFGLAACGGGTSISDTGGGDTGGGTGGGDTGGGTGDGGTGGATLDMAGVFGTGTSGDPFIVPDYLQGDGSQGIDAYLTSGDFWKLTYNGLAQMGTTVLGEMVYDTANNQWFIVVDGVKETLTDNGATYSCSSCTTAGSAEFSLYGADDPAVAKYGTFATLIGGTTADAITIVHSGLLTPVAELPSGTATYTGEYAGYLDVTSALYTTDTPLAASGSATMNVDFGAKTVDLSIPTTSIYTNLDGTETLSYSVAVTGTIVDNTYSGTTDLNFQYKNSTIIIPVNESVTATGTVDGAFYGPGAVETAAVMQVNDVVSTSAGAITIDYAGGYWGTQTP